MVLEAAVVVKAVRVATEATQQPLDNRQADSITTLIFPHNIVGLEMGLIFIFVGTVAAQLVAPPIIAAPHTHTAVSLISGAT